MCVIVHLGAKKTLPKDLLKNCYDNNRDGWGILWAKDNKLHSIKETSSFDEFLKIWHHVPRDAERALHFRFKTHGLINRENCHPFHIADNYALMHNGVIDCQLITPNMSDTFNFCEHEVKPIIKGYNELGANPLFDQPFVELMQSLAGCSRLLFMDKEGNVLKTNQKDWRIRYGCDFSNGNNFENRYVSNSTGYTGSTTGRGYGHGFDMGADYEDEWTAYDDETAAACGYYGGRTEYSRVHDNTRSVSSGAVNSGSPIIGSDWRTRDRSGNYDILKDVENRVNRLLTNANEEEKDKLNRLATDLASGGKTEAELENYIEEQEVIRREVINQTNGIVIEEELPESDDLDEEMYFELEQLVGMSLNDMYEVVLEYPRAAACTIEALADACKKAGILEIAYRRGSSSGGKSEVKSA